jgi:hypothetical protein
MIPPSLAWMTYRRSTSGRSLTFPGRYKPCRTKRCRCPSWEKFERKDSLLCNSNRTSLANSGIHHQAGSYGDGRADEQQEVQHPRTGDRARLTLPCTCADDCGAIAIAGAPRDFAKRKSICILRQNPGGGHTRIFFNYKDLLNGYVHVWLHAGASITTPSTLFVGLSPLQRRKPGKTDITTKDGEVESKLRFPFPTPRQRRDIYNARCATLTIQLAQNIGQPSRTATGCRLPCSIPNHMKERL